MPTHGSLTKQVKLEVRHPKLSEERLLVQMPNLETKVILEKDLF